MKFSDFQTESGTLRKMDKDGFGDPFEIDSIPVNVDPVFGFNRIYTDEDEEVTGRTTTITADGLQDFWDLEHYHYVLTYKTKDWQIKEPTPFYKINTNTLEHIEVTLR